MGEQNSDHSTCRALAVTRTTSSHFINQASYVEPFNIYKIITYIKIAFIAFTEFENCKKLVIASSKYNFKSSSVSYLLEVILKEKWEKSRNCILSSSSAQTFPKSTKKEFQTRKKTLCILQYRPLQRKRRQISILIYAERERCRATKERV